MEDQETLKSGTLVSELSHAVQDQVNDLLSNGVMSTGIVVGCIFLVGDQLFWVEELSVCSSSDLIYDSGFQINKDSSWHVFPCSSFGEKCVEGIITTSNGFVTRHLTVRLDAMFQAVQLPTGIAHLHTSLSNMN